MSVKDFPITLGFRAVYDPYYTPTKAQSSNPALWLGPFHAGNDYGCPVGTQVVVNGTVIALSGKTGAAAGPHSHVDKKPLGTGDQNGGNYYVYLNPSDAFSITGVVAFAGLNGTAGLMVGIQADNGNYYRFLHNSSILVKVGQRVGGNMATDSLTKEEIQVIYTLTFETDIVPQDVINAYTGQPLSGLLTLLHNDPTWQKHFNEVNNPPPPPNIKVLPKGDYRVQ